MAIPLLLILSIIPHYVFADGGNLLDVRTVPSHIMENTDSIIQVYPKTFGSTIDNLVATSSDSSVVQILDTEKYDTPGAYDIKIRALSPGQVTIAVAAPGFSSLEVPITVYQYSEGATNLLIKTTPNTFSSSGPNVGYVSVETTNPDGVPTIVSADTTIKLSVSDSNIVGLTYDQLTIKKGSYFAMEKFVTNNPGTAQIYASSSSMQPVSSTVTVKNMVAPYTLQVYAYPPIVNSNNNAVSYVIVQLHDAGGFPVIAKNDIPISVRITNPTDQDASNTSGQSPSAQVNDALIIKKGSYWGYVPVEFTSGTNETFDVNIAAKDYIISAIPSTTTITTSTTTVSGSTTVTSSTSGSGATTTSSTISGTGATSAGNTTATSTTTASSASKSLCTLNPIKLSTSQVQIAAMAQNFIMDDKTPCFYPLPILATGNNELIGVLALKDSSGYPVLAKSSLSFRIDSSDTSTISIPGVAMDYGAQSALVFAQVGNTANPVTLNVVSASPQQVTPTILSPSQATSGLTVDSLLTTVLPDTKFPLAVYATNNGVLGSLSNDFNALMSPQESISPVQLSITKGDPIFLTDETLLKDGIQNIAITTSDYSSSFTVTGASLKPSSILLDFPDQIFSNSKNLFSIELLDDKQLPILADQDINVKLVSSDPSVLNIPDNVQIKKGSYYATFGTDSKSAGTTEIAVLTDELPLSKFDVTVTSYTPVVTVDSNDHADNNSPLTATVTATYNQLPLAGLNVDWAITGATTKSMDSLTDKDGKATISLITNDPNTVNIQASVGGGPYQTVTATKQVSINPPLQPATTAEQSGQTSQQPSGFTILGASPLILIIPGAAAAAFVVLKKKQMLEGITERINIADTFSGLKDRMSESRQR